MKAIHPFIRSAAILALLGSLASPGAFAQRGARPTGGIVSTRVSPANSVKVHTSSRTRASANGGIPPGEFGGFSVFPSLGFNTFGGIMNQNLGIRAVIDPATQLRLAAAERFLRNRRGTFPGLGGYYLLDGGGAYIVAPESIDSSEAQQPPVMVVQQPPPQDTAAVPSTEPPVSASLLPDEGSFTLVLHDGRQIQAVAFTHAKEKIIYITPDGGRHTVAVTDIDSDATVQLNQERGTPLQLPL